MPSWIKRDPESMTVDVDMFAALSDGFSILHVSYSEETNNIEVAVRRIRDPEEGEVA
jgi:hypothetical protein